jgi:hypothetical protein
VAALAVLGVVGTGSVIAADQRSDDSPNVVELDPAVAAYVHGGAYAVGSTIHFGDTDDYSVTLPEKVKSLYYTSVGVVVRTGNNAGSDDPGPSHYTLVTPSGDVSQLDLDLGDRVPSTDPTSPYLAYGDADGDGWAVVLRNVETDTVAARVPVPGDFTWGGWRAPPVALSGDRIYVVMDDATYAVDWSSGDATSIDRLPGASYPDISGGHAATSTKTETTVFDVATGEDLLTIPHTGYGYVTFSPDGRYLMSVVDATVSGPEPFDVYDVSTGDHATIDQASWDFGWTPDGHLLKVQGDQVTTCEPISGDCDTVDVDNGPGEVKLGGQTYES